MSLLNVVDQAPLRLMISDKIVRFAFADEIERLFVNLANTPENARLWYACNASSTSISMRNIGREVMCNLPISLLPLAEQYRIVAKVDDLTPSSGALEDQIASSRTLGAALLEAVVAKLAAED